MVETAIKEPETQHCFVLVGLPGAGKSAAAEIIRNELAVNFVAARTFEVSDYVREMYEEEHDRDVTDNELGRWSAARKHNEGEGYFLSRMAADHYGEGYHTIIAGVRSPAEAEAVRDEFGVKNTTVIALWTLPDLRFERKYGDVPSEEHEMWETFQERNERELHEWGCVEFFTGSELSDYIVPNNGSLEGLEYNMTRIVKESALGGSKLAGQWRNSPFPDDRPEYVAQYL